MGRIILNGNQYMGAPSNIIEVTLAEYIALGDVVNTDGKLYCITDLNNSDVQGYPPLIYSDEEREVGVWRDGKPLYQKTVHFTTGSSDAYLNYLTDIQNPDFMSVLYDGSFYIYNTAYVNATPYFGTLATNDTMAFAVLCLPYNDCLRIDYRVGTSVYSKDAYVTVIYTKTTDVAGSGIWNGQGGYAHHYGTSEKVIGTWIDGKSLYEKTISIGVLPNNTTNTIAHGIVNLKTVVNLNGYAKNTNNGICIPIPYNYKSGTVSKCVQVYADATNIMVSSMENVSGYTESFITIQYTKITD